MVMYIPGYEMISQLKSDLLTPDYYRGDPKALHDDRRTKLVEVRHGRRETALALRQKTLAFRDPKARTDGDG
jgi:hypothetical protein